METRERHRRTAARMIKRHTAGLLQLYVSLPFASSRLSLSLDTPRLHAPLLHARWQQRQRRRRRLLAACCLAAEGAACVAVTREGGGRRLELTAP